MRSTKLAIGDPRAEAKRMCTPNPAGGLHLTMKSEKAGLLVGQLGIKTRLVE
jgi:hypothetical protein